MVKYIELKPGFCFSAALALMVLPLRWILAWVVASAVHELGHILVLRLWGSRIFGFSMSSHGAEIFTEFPSPLAEFLCAMAGPAFSFLLLTALRRMPLVALCGLTQGLVNLIPVMPFDGGRGVGSLLAMFCLRHKETVQRWLLRGTCLGILLVGIWMAVHLQWGMGGILGCFFLLRKVNPIKIPCKAAAKGVQ